MVPDIDEASSTLQMLENQDNILVLCRITSRQTLHLSQRNEQELSISSIYDTILQNWIAPLPNSISSRVRQSKEQLARRIAAEATLASLRIRHARPRELTELPNRTESGPSEESAGSLPVPLFQQNESGLDDVKFPSLQPSLPSSQLLFSSDSGWKHAFPSSQPTFPPGSYHPTAPPTPRPVSSTPPFSAPAPIAINHLSRHLRVNKPIPKIPHAVSRILGHWQLSTDPQAYDWEATTQAMDLLQDDEELNTEQRGKARRKEERMRKRQKREEDLSRSKAESQPLFLRSSPGPTLGGLGMSSQTQSQAQPFPFVVQSQIEPGLHGGRPKIKKKLKARVSGF